MGQVFACFCSYHVPLLMPQRDCYNFKASASISLITQCFVLLYAGIPSSDIALLTQEEEFRTCKLRSLMEGEIKGDRVARAMLEPQITGLLAATKRLKADIERMNAQAVALSIQLDAMRTDLTQKEIALSVSRRVRKAQLMKIAILTREGERLRCVLCCVAFSCT